MEVSLPYTWQIPTIDKYDDNGDPDEHVDAYVTHISLYTADGALLCRVSPTSLKRVSFVEDGCCPFKIVFDEDLYVVFDEDLYVHFMCIFALL